MSTQRKLSFPASKESVQPYEKIKKQKKKKEALSSKTCEKMTLQRTLQCSEGGATAAKIAKARGKTVADHRGYISLMGTNNTAAWMSGWNKEWERMNVESV